MFPLPEVLLAPLTKGGNLPFRRLCVEFGAELTMSEMAYARKLKRGVRSEFALLRKHESEGCFGVQIAAGNPPDAIEAAKIAVDKGADFVDLNCGCPIHDVVKRGMGATLLRRSENLGRVVESMVEAVDVPITVKIRLGWNEKELNALEIAQLCEKAGASMLTLHGRTREQRYSKPARWEQVKELVDALSIPVVGNGDIGHWFDADARRQMSGAAAVMVARGALIKPWLFKECAEKKTWNPDADERVGVLLRFVELMKEHFGSDEKGRKRAFYFLPWHMSFFARYRPVEEIDPAQVDLQEPLLQRRNVGEAQVWPEDPLERLLRDPREDVQEQLAGLLWDRGTEEGFLDVLRAFGAELSIPDQRSDEVAVAQG